MPVISFSISFSGSYLSKYLYRYQQDTKNQGQMHIIQHFSCQELSAQANPKRLNPLGLCFHVQYIELFI